MTMGGRPFRDDRGQRVRLRQHKLIHAVRLSPRERHVVKTYDRLVDTIKAAHPLNLLSTSLGMLVLGAMSAWMTHVQWQQAVFSYRLAFVLFAFAAAFALVGIASPFVLIARRRFLEIEIRRLPRLCPQCLYDLAGSPAEDDGCTVCPECGAAWRFGEPASIPG